MYMEICPFITRIEKMEVSNHQYMTNNDSSFRTSWKIQIDVARRNIKPEESFKDRIIFMSMFNEIDC